MLLEFGDVCLRGLCSVVPKGVRSIMDMEGISERDAKRLAKSTGFEQFHVAEKGKTSADYCTVAAEYLVKQMNIDIQTIDALVFISQTPDYIAPATSGILHDRLGLRQDAMIFDINHGCPGFVYGMFQASSLVHSGCSRVLLCVGDTVSRYASSQDRSTYLVFGDAAAAALLESGNQQSAYSFYTDGSRFRALGIKDGGMRHMFTNASLVPHEDDQGNVHNDYQIHMDGAEIMAFSLEVVPKLIHNLLEELSIEKEKIDIFALHQANKLIVTSIAKKLQVPLEKVPFVATQFGNTSLASIPLLLSIMYGMPSNKQMKGNAVLCGFGVGLSAAAVYVPLNDTQIMRCIEL